MANSPPPVSLLQRAWHCHWMPTPPLPSLLRHFFFSLSLSHSFSGLVQAVHFCFLFKCSSRTNFAPITHAMHHQKFTTKHPQSTVATTTIICRFSLSLLCLTWPTNPPQPVHVFVSLSSFLIFLDVLVILSLSLSVSFLFFSFLFFSFFFFPFLFFSFLFFTFPSSSRRKSLNRES